MSASERTRRVRAGPNTAVQYRGPPRPGVIPSAATRVAASTLFFLFFLSRRNKAMTSVAQQTGSDKTPIRPFSVNFPEAELTELRRRINPTKWPERETVTDASQGEQLATVQALAQYRGTDYDCRQVEPRLNALPNFITENDGR